MSMLDMSLDDIAKARKNKKSNQGANNNKQANKAGPIRNNNKQARANNTPISRPQNNIRAPKRNSLDGNWTHDKFNNNNQAAGRKGNNTNATSRGKKVEVANLFWEITDANILEVFSQAGDVKVARVLYDDQGRSTGNAFVVYNNVADAENAVSMLNGALLDNRAMRVSFPSPTAPVLKLKAADNGERNNNRNNNNNNNNNNRKLNNNNAGPKKQGDQQKPKGDKPKKERAEKKAPVTSEGLDSALDSYFGTAAEATSA